MKVTIIGGKVLVEKEPGDERIRDESDLFHKVKKVLNSRGDNLVKKAPGDEGHLTSAPYYLRDKDWKYCIIDNEYAIRDPAKEYRDTGQVTLMFIVWDRPVLQPDLFKEK